MPTTSNRPDGRGHWPAGKRRHPPVPGWAALRRRLLQLLAQPMNKQANGQRVSRRALAAWIGISDRTIGRWLRGVDQPSPEGVEKIKQWVSNTKGKRHDSRTRS